MSLQSANVQDEARLNNAADGFWGCSHQCVLFNVRSFNPFARTHRGIFLEKHFRGRQINVSRK